MPIFEVEHEGQIYEVDAPDMNQAAAAAQAFKPAAPKQPGLGDTVPGTPEDAALHQRLATEQAATPAPESSLWDDFTNFRITPDFSVGDLGTAIMGAPEAVGTMLNNAIGTGVAGLTAPFVSNSDEDAANYIRDFEEHQLYQPQGESAQKLTQALGEGLNMEPAREALGGAALEATDSPLAATAAHIVPDALAMFAGGGAASDGPALAAKAPKSTTLPPVVEDLRAAGLKMRPSDVRAITPDRNVKVPGEFREKFSNAADLKEGLTLDNQAVLSKRAADEIGAKDLSDASLKEAEAPHIKTYELAESVAGSKPVIPELERTLREAIDSVKVELPRGEKPTVLRVLSTLRNKATRLLKSENAESNNQGFAARNMADALEEAFGKQLEAAGEPQLLKQYQDARQSLAKIYDVRDSTHANQIDAAMLKRLNERAGGERLSGGLKLVADASEFAPNVTGHSTKTAARAGNEIKDSKEGITKSLVKGAIRKIPGMDVGAEGFQNKFGSVDPARSSYYGQKPPNFVERAPEQPDMLGEMLGLKPPPGRAGAPQESSVAEDLGQVFVGGEPLAEPITNYSATSLEDILGLSEPLVKKPKKRG